MEITINQNENQLINIGNSTVQDININQNENQLITIGNTEVQNVNVSHADNQTILIDGGGVAYGITDVLVNGVSVVTNNIAYVIVPTKTSELINNSGFLTSETDPTVPTYVKQISLSDINNWNSKQNALVSGGNIKTINNESLLGSGNINITGTTYTAGDGIDITNEVISNTITSYDDLTDLPTIPDKVSDLTNDLDFVSENDLSEVAFTGSYASLSNTPENLSEFTNDEGFIDNTVDDLVNYTTTTDMNTALASKQDTLVSGTNIKTINNTSLLGSGDISIAGSVTDVQINGTSITSNNVADIIVEGTYDSTTNKIATMSEIPTTTSELTNNSGFIDNTVNNLTNYMLSSDINTALNNKQDTLVSGTNIKTINNESLLGSGNINTNIYSNSEIAIGVWIDNKTIYRKVITYTFNTANQWNAVPHNISNIYQIVNYKTIIYYNLSGYYYEVPNDIILETRINNTNYEYYFNNTNMQNNASGTVIIEYTKTI